MIVGLLSFPAMNLPIHIRDNFFKMKAIVLEEYCKNNGFDWVILSNELEIKKWLEKLPE